MQYKYDDNVRVTPTNKIQLAGWEADGNVDLTYATQRFNANANLELSTEQYNDVSTSKLQPGLQEPKASDFNSDNQDLKASVAYNWERQQVSLYGRYWRDSTLNTQFLDTGLGGLATIEGATRRENALVNPQWQWTMTERQGLRADLQWQSVKYGSLFYTDYDYSNASITWTYLWSERLSLQVRPLASYYENKAPNKVESTTYGLQGGAIWKYSESLDFNILLGATQVKTTIDGGYYAFDFENFQIVFVEFEDQKSNGFTGSFNAKYTQETYGASLDVYTQYSPSASGELREDSQLRALLYWKPWERVRLDLDSRYGNSDSASNRGNNQRKFAEAGLRLAYQFAHEWWFSARYRYRMQDYDYYSSGSGKGNLFSASISFRLPKEIL